MKINGKKSPKKKIKRMNVERIKLKKYVVYSDYEKKKIS